MPKRIEPLSSRAQIVANPAPEEKVNGVSLAPPRRLRRSRGERNQPPKKKWSFWKKVWITFQIGVLIVIILGSVAGYFIYEKALVYYARAETYDLKKLDDLNVTSTFYDVNGEELGRIFVEDRIVLKPDEIPDTMREAVMAAEDRRFRDHGAIDYWGILRAMRENLLKKSHGVQGGSTIEQQLAKHLIGDFSRTMDRKFLEAFVAIRLEQNFTKDQIMNYYLNRIYFGKGYFGVGAASRGYFGKEARDLTVPECALLAGIIRAPTSSSPRVDLIKAKWRRDATLRQMLEEGYIQKDEYIRYVNTPVAIQPAKPSGLQTFVMAAAVKEMEQILSIEGTEEMPQGLTVHTNIDLRLQKVIEDEMNLKLGQIENSTAGSVQAGQARPPLQGSAIVADLETGRVRAWVGGRDFSKSQFDHISMAKRENGALLQPVLYALGFDRLNLSPASMINSSYIDPTVSATSADLALGDPMVDLGKWFLSVQDALALGNKAAATRVGLQLGAGPVTSWLRQAGLDQARVPNDKPNVFNPEPMTLGDVASLYQVLGNDGVHRKLKIIQSIESRAGEILYDDSRPDREGHQDALLNNLDDRQMTLTLQNALRSGPARTLTRDYDFRSAVAGMPGYSEGYRDAWFVGYTPKILTGVWVGYDDSRPIGDKDIAIRSAVPLWGDIMRQIEARTPTGGQFSVPAVLSKVEIDRATGGLRGLAGLAPAPGDIFVYLKKEQVDAADGQSNQTAQQLQAPREWSDWLTTMFNEADETGLSPDQVMDENKRSNLIPALAEYKMPGLRGDILSSDGTVFATTTAERNLVLGWPAADEATVDDEIVRWMRSRLDEVQQVIGIKVDVTDANLIAQYHAQRYQPFLVLENVTPDQVNKIQSAGLESRGFGFQTAPLRAYPHGPELAHVLGYLSRSQQRNRGKYLSGDVIYDRYKGASGIEAVVDKDLTGKDGRFMISTTPDGYARSAVVADPAGYGNNVRLSIDSRIQDAAEEAMSNSPKKLNAVVMMDIHTGDVVAMASHPTFDPNIFVPTIAADEWQLLNTDQFNPLLNRAIHAQYPPGSSFKTVTSIAAMDAGVFDPNWVVHCTGFFDIGNVHMVLPEEHGDVTYHEAFTYSYNTYFMQLGLKVGRDILLDTARSLNLGSLTNIDLPGELPGCIPDNEFVKRVHNREFGGGDLANTSIGQGDVLVTPVQMACLMAAIANGGTVWHPRLIKQVEDRSGHVVKTFPVEALRTVTFDPKWMPELKSAMINVVDEGTAKVAHRDDMKIAAKTGTAQVGSKEHHRQIAWLCGYLPADNPQYSFAVMVEGQFSDNRDNTLTGGLLGGVDAAGIAKDIFAKVYPVPGAKDKDKDKDKSQDATTAAATPAASAAHDDGTTASNDDHSATPAKPAEPASDASVVVPAHGGDTTP
ncbi:MAG: transglycosylase domain-containing protein [Methylacidiphilales bacterium]|nr:transglycosylase domain-containing protein [Candidatus Methylacidiphilales bacterium]